MVGAAIRLESQDAGTAAAPTLELFRNSASPADGDDIGQILFRGEDDGGAITSYAGILGEIVDVTGGTEDGRLRFFTATAGGFTEKLRIEESGDVGIGTTNPQGTLHVKNTSDSATLTSVSDSIVLSHQSGSYTDGNYYGVLGFAKANSNGGTLGAAIAPVMDGTGAGTDLTFSTAVAAGSCIEKMRITDSGNVGIGLTSPSSLLHLQSTGTPKILVQDSDGTNTYGEFYHDGGSTYIASRAGSGNGSLIVGGSGGGSFDEHLRIDSSGNVGIGASSPSTQLHVQDTGVSGLTLERNLAGAGASTTLQPIIFGGMDSGSANANHSYAKIDTITTSITNGSESGDLRFFTSGSGTLTERMRIDSSGNVGIGTGSPDANLQVRGSGDRSIAITSGTAGAAILNFGDTTSGDFDIGSIIYDNSNNSMQFKTNNSERMRIDLSLIHI